MSILTKSPSFNGKDQPPTINQILPHCLIEILGEEDFRKIWSAPLDEILFPLDPIHSALVHFFGKNAANGILFCLGRSMFTQILIWMGEQAGFSRKEFKLLPLRRKIPAGMENLAAVLRHGLTDQIEICTDAGIHFWVMTGDSPHPEMSCVFYRGLLQEYMAWMCSGKVFIVEEVTCRKDGASECCFQIPSNSIE